MRGVKESIMVNTEPRFRGVAAKTTNPRASPGSGKTRRPVLENQPTRLSLSTRTKTERTAAHHLRDERHDFASECQIHTARQASISEPLRRDDIINSRLRELEAATSQLRRDAELESRRLQAMLDELALADRLSAG
jgi:hypothetical protein